MDFSKALMMPDCPENSVRCEDRENLCTVARAAGAAGVEGTLLVGGLEHVLFFHILGRIIIIIIIIELDFWLVVLNILFHILGSSSSQLTFIFCRGVEFNHQPVDVFFGKSIQKIRPRKKIQRYYTQTGYEKLRLLGM